MKGLSIFVLMILVSCNGGGSGGGSSAPSPTVVTKSFLDTTVSNFSQVSGVASYQKAWYEYIVERAYAGGGDIRCIDGTPIEVTMDITLGFVTQPLNVQATCGGDVDLRIRQEMLSALDGHVMVLEVAGSGSVGSDYKLDFSQAEGFQFDIPYATLEDRKTFAAQTHDCMIDYVFNSATGTVSSKIATTALPGRAKSINQASNTAWGFANPYTPVAGNGYAGCKSQDGEYRTADFRFKDGKIEMDESGLKSFDFRLCVLRDGSDNIVDHNLTGYFQGTDVVCPNGYDSPYERWCIDDDADGSCDN